MPVLASGIIGGLSIYGEKMGRFAIDPTLIVSTAQDVVRPASKGGK